MTKYRTIFLILLIILICCSCATILNLPEEYISIITDEPALISTGNFRSDTTSEYTDIIVRRSSKPLKLSVASAESSRNYTIEPNNSFAYWLNLYPSTFWVGFFVDMKNPKRYSYPCSVYINPIMHPMLKEKIQSRFFYLV
jgi:hypothetical protein